MAIDDNVISKLEKLSKLKLEADERVSIANDLEKMLDMVDKLSEVDTEGVEPLVYIHSEVNVLRADKATGMLDRETALANAPKKVGNYFAVPKVINKS